MRKVKSVNLPERTVTTKTKSGTYVYLTQKVEYSSSLKCSRPKRIAIGKLDDNGMLIPNKNYFDIYGSQDEMAIPGDRCDFLSIGPQIVVSSISENLHLMDLLQSVFDDDADKILDVATYMMMSENNIMQYFEDYGYGHSLFNIENFTDSTIGNLLKNMSVKDIDLFIKGWVKMHAGKDIYISYDSSNMNSTAGNLELAEYGHAKDDPELPQVNLSLGYNQTDQIPLFYELYPGSIIDNTECEKMVERAIYYGCKGIGFILDRGYFSKKNIKYFEDNGYQYVLMGKGNAKFIRESIEESRAILKNGYSCFLEEHELYGVTVEKDLFGTGKIQYIHVYYDGIRAEAEKIEINKKYVFMEEALDSKVKNKIKRKEDVKKYEPYYKMKFDENGYFLAYQKKTGKIEEEIDSCGYFAIVTSKKMDAQEALNIYRDRDAVEKIFRMEKSYLGFDVFRVHTEGKLESKIFISFIALIIRNEIHNLTKPLYKKNRKENTVPKILKQIERLGLTKLSDEEYHIRYALTKRQKQLLGIIGISDKRYISIANEIISQFK